MANSYSSCKDSIVLGDVVKLRRGVVALLAIFSSSDFESERVV